MSEWRPVETAPRNTTVIVWGGVAGGGLRFMRLDDIGQWRNMTGVPKSPPSHWMMPPEPPKDG